MPVPCIGGGGLFNQVRDILYGAHDRYLPLVFRKPFLFFAEHDNIPLGKDQMSIPLMHFDLLARPNKFATGM